MRRPPTRALALLAVLLVAACAADSSTVDGPDGSGTSAEGSPPDVEPVVQPEGAPDAAAPAGGDEGGDAAPSPSEEPDAAPEPRLDTIEPEPAGDTPLAEPDGMVTQPDAPSEDSAAPVACPAPLGIEGEGRLRDLGNFEHPGLLPRRVRALLPLGFDPSGETRYPIIVMHDGQNLFEPFEAAFGVEWQVDETVDALVVADLIEAPIVLGIDNTVERIDDYTPDLDPEHPDGGKADLYADLVVETILPWVDDHLPTRCEAAGRTLLGSSLGGLVSVHVHMRHPDAFRGIGAVSPSFWWEDGAMVVAASSWEGSWPARLWMDLGTAESPGRVVEVRAIRDALLAQGLAFGDRVGVLEVIGGEHNEAAWAARLPAILAWLQTDQDLGIEAPLSLEVAAANPVLVPAQSTSLHAQARWIEPLTLSVPALWATETPTILDVEDEGWVVGVAAGEGSLQATWGAASAEGTLEVVDEGEAAVSFEVFAPEDTPEGDTLYVAGGAAELNPSGGVWDPAGAPLDSPLAATLPHTTTLSFPVGSIVEFKVTRGSWATVEKAADGSEIANHVLLVQGPETVEVHVEAWADL